MGPTYRIQAPSRYIVLADAWTDERHEDMDTVERCAAEIVRRTPYYGSKGRMFRHTAYEFLAEIGYGRAIFVDNDGWRFCSMVIVVAEEMWGRVDITARYR